MTATLTADNGLSLPARMPMVDMPHLPLTSTPPAAVRTFADDLSVSRSDLDRARQWLSSSVASFDSVPSSSSLATGALLVSALWKAAGRHQGENTGGSVLLPQVFPLPGGGLQLEWHAYGDHIEAAVETDDTIGLTVESADLGITVAIEVTSVRVPIPQSAYIVLAKITDAVWAVAGPKRR